MTNVTSLEKAAEKLAKGGKGSRRPKAEKSSGTYDANGKRVIRHLAGELPSILDQLGAALAEANANLFRYAGRLARVYQAGEEQHGDVKRAAGALLVHPVEAAHLQELGGRAADHEKWDSRSTAFVPCDMPRRVADVYLARGHWPELPALNGFVEAPTITPDWRLIDQPGYDIATGLFSAYATIPGYRRPPEKPTRNDALRALDTLSALFESFPFVDDSDRSAMLAGVLTSVLRRMLPAAPMFAITAPTPGTGKTLLCETLAILATDRRASVLSLGHDDAETEKRLTGVLLAGDAVISIDNIERPLKGDLLCQVTTQQFVRLRPLGGSGMLSIPTHALLVATGNNLSIVGDLKRRVVLVRLDAGIERPEQRTFDTDHLASVSARRGEIITAALTLVLSYGKAGAPTIAGLHALGGFEIWDRMVRRPLVWLGLPDPLVASEGLRDQDPDIEAMRLLFSSWLAVFSNVPTTAPDVVAAGNETSPMTQTYSNTELRDALQLVCAEKPNSRRLSFWLRAHRERIVDGLQLQQSGIDGHAKIARWRIVKCG